MMVHRGIRLVFWVILSFLLSSAVCIMLYFLNNKYTDPAPQAENGYLDLTQETEETYPLRFLRDGWAFYPDTLLGPEDFNDGAPEEYMVYTSIGDFTRFDRMGTRETPFGCGTWVLDLWLPETGDYALELPEIFSAYRFYVNDRLVLQTGDPDPETYTPKTQIRTIHLNDSYGDGFLNWEYRFWLYSSSVRWRRIFFGPTLFTSPLPNRTVSFPGSLPFRKLIIRS